MHIWLMKKIVMKGRIIDISRYGDHVPKKKNQRNVYQFNDLDQLLRYCAFKDSLYQIVMQRGRNTKLSQLQTSTAFFITFFNSISQKIYSF